MTQRRRTQIARPASRAGSRLSVPTVAATILAAVAFVPTTPLPAQEGSAETVRARDEGPAPADSAAATLTGRVVSASTGRPLDGAVVALVGSGAGAITDSTGAFRIPRTPPGPDTVRIRFIGYEASDAPIELRPAATTRAVFLLSPTAVRVAELRVEVERRSDTEVSGFDERRRQGFGYFMSRREIEEAKPLETSDLFRRIPGVDVSQDGGGRQAVFMHRDGEFCKPYLYLDGRRLEYYRLDRLQPLDLEAIEVYRRASEAPLRFPIGDCGAVVVWTRGTSGDRNAEAP